MIFIVKDNSSCFSALVSRMRDRQNSPASDSLDFATTTPSLCAFAPRLQVVDVELLPASLKLFHGVIADLANDIVDET